MLLLLAVAVCVQTSSEKKVPKQPEYEQLGFKRVRRASTGKRAEESSEGRSYNQEIGCDNPNLGPAESLIEQCSAVHDNWSFPRSCSDPYFGGSPECCLAGKECKKCLGAKQCDRALLQCTRGYLESCDSQKTSNNNLSSTFRDRRDTCVRGSETQSYWNHPGFVLRGAFVDFNSPFRTSNATECAQSCALVFGCTAFLYTAKIKTCQLKTGEFTDVCDPVGDDMCVQPSVDILVLDTERMYCSSEAIGCACSREFYYCMKKEGCVDVYQDVLEIADYANMCVEGGCSSVQCGLASSPSEKIAAACTNEFFACATGQGSSCGCTATYTKCMDGVSETGANRIDEISGLNVIDMCLSEGCTAADCGLVEISCNATSLTCGDKFLACKVSFNLSALPC